MGSVALTHLGFIAGAHPLDDLLHCWVPARYEKDHKDEGVHMKSHDVQLSDSGMDAVGSRQAAWLAGDAKASWRPLKLHRVAAKHWVLAFDNQLRQPTSYGGLSHLF